VHDERRVDEAVERTLRAAGTVSELMRTAARLVTEAVDGSACAISRMLGDVLVEVAEFAGSRATLYLGQGYLVSDYPLTREVIERREPRSVYVPDPDADEHEVALLDKLGFTSLLMLPLCVRDDVWGLAEVYREGIHRFVDTDAARATWLFQIVGERLAELEERR
jgi:hypothetical protein